MEFKNVGFVHTLFWWVWRVASRGARRVDASRHPTSDAGRRGATARQAPSSNSVYLYPSQFVNIIKIGGEALASVSAWADASGSSTPRRHGRRRRAPAGTQMEVIRLADSPARPSVALAQMFRRLSRV